MWFAVFGHKNKFRRQGEERTDSIAEALAVEEAVSRSLEDAEREAMRRSLLEDENAKALIRSEEQLINSRLQRYGLMRIDTEGIGNCQYAAIVETLGLDLTYNALRQTACDRMQRSGNFQQESVTLNRADGYVGNEFTFRALSEELGRPIRLVTNRPDTSEAGPVEEVVGEHHCDPELILAYYEGRHYEATQRLAIGEAGRQPTPASAPIAFRPLDALSNEPTATDSANDIPKQGCGQISEADRDAIMEHERKSRIRGKVPLRFAEKCVPGFGMAQNRNIQHQKARQHAHPSDDAERGRRENPGRKPGLRAGARFFRAVLEICEHVTWLGDALRFAFVVPISVNPHSVGMLEVACIGIRSAQMWSLCFASF